MGRKLSLLIVAVIAIAVGYGVLVTVKPAVGETVGKVANDQVIKPGGTAVSNAVKGVVASPFWKTYIAPTPNAFAIGFGACIVAILLLRKVKLPSIFSKPKAALGGLDTMQREPAEPERQPAPLAPSQTVAAPEQPTEQATEATAE